MASTYYFLVVNGCIVGPGSCNSLVPVPPHCIPCTQTQAEAWQTLEVVSGVIQAIPAATLLATAQAQQNALNHASYLQAIQGPVSFTSAGGITAMYQADPQSIANLYASLATWQLKGAAPSGFYWKAADNSKVPFTYADLQGLAQAMGEPGEAAWVKWEGLKADVAAASLSTVSSFVW
jgi:hypothetical protein